MGQDTKLIFFVIRVCHFYMGSQLGSVGCLEVTFTATYIPDFFMHHSNVALQVPLIESCKGA